MIGPRRIAVVSAALVLAGSMGGTAGFVVGLRWPIETVEQWLGIERNPARRGWAVFAETDLPRYEMIKVQIDSALYLFGGFHTSETRATNRVEVLDLTNGDWERLGDMPVAVTHAPATRINGEIWIVGGFEGDHPGAATAKVWRYEVASDRWSEGPSLPEPRGGGVLVALGDTLHFAGGYMTDRDTNSSNHWALPPDGRAWSSRAPLPKPRGHASALVRDGLMYVVGGSDRHDPLPIDVRWVDVYDPATDEWSAFPDSPFSTSHTEAATVSIDGYVTFVGGRDRGRGQENQDDILLLRDGVLPWIHAGRTPRAIMGGMAAVWKDTLFAGLGAEYGNSPTNPYVWKRPLRDVWYAADTLPESLGEVSAGIIDGVMYVVGEGSPHTLAYDVASGRWLDPRAIAARPSQGNHHAAEVVGGELWLLGGLTFSEGSVQVFDPVANKWRFGPELPFAAGSSASAVIEDRIYVAGGIVNRTTMGKAAFLDPEVGTWTSIADMPLPVNHAASATDGRLWYIFGGRGPGSGDGNVVANGFDYVQVYDPDTDQWRWSDGSPGAPLPLPQPRGGTGKAVFLAGEFWILGGETLDGEGANSDGTYGRVDIFDPRTNSWRKGPDLPTPRHGIFPVSLADRVFVAGGGRRSGWGQSNTFEVIWPR